MAWDKAAIVVILKEQAEGKDHRYIVYRMLQGLYERQTADEQESKDTHHSNGKGFNGRDAHFLSNVAATSKAYKSLTPGQAKYVAKTLVKYAGQLAEIAAANQQQSL